MVRGNVGLMKTIVFTKENINTLLTSYKHVFTSKLLVFKLVLDFRLFMKLSLLNRGFAVDLHMSRNHHSLHLGGSVDNWFWQINDNTLVYKITM